MRNRDAQPFVIKDRVLGPRGRCCIVAEIGVDLILGHSAHRLQGIEIINGKAVVYDMGNLLFDCKLKEDGRRTAIFRDHLTASGVRKIAIIPVQALNGHSVLAEGSEAGSLSPEGETPRRGTPWYTRHDPGDRSVPFSLLKPGDIVKDHYPARLQGLPPGRCRIYAMIIDTSINEGNRIQGKPRYIEDVEILKS